MKPNKHENYDSIKWVLAVIIILLFLLAYFLSAGEIKKIEGLVMDSTNSKVSVFSYNQFMPPSLIEIKPNSFFTGKQIFNTLINLNNVNFRVYTSNYNAIGEKIYSYDNFIEYEKANSIIISVVKSDVISVEKNMSQ